MNRESRRAKPYRYESGIAKMELSESLKSKLVGSREDFSLQLGAAINNTSDIITVAVQSDTAGADAGAIISWNTLT